MPGVADPLWGCPAALTASDCQAGQPGLFRNWCTAVLLACKGQQALHDSAAPAQQEMRCHGAHRLPRVLGKAMGREMHVCLPVILSMS